MIKIKQYTPPQLSLYGPDDVFIGFVNNQVEMLRVRIDIITLVNNSVNIMKIDADELSGYYFIYGSNRIDISYNGKVINMPNDLYDEVLKNTINLNNLQNKIK